MPAVNTLVEHRGTGSVSCQIARDVIEHAVGEHHPLTIEELKPHLSPAVQEHLAICGNDLESRQAKRKGKDVDDCYAHAARLIETALLGE